MSLLIPRRKLLLGALAAPYVISSRKAAAFFSKGGGTTVVGDPLATLLATVSPGNWVAAANVSTRSQAQLAAGGVAQVFPTPLPTFSFRSGNPNNNFSDWVSQTVDTKRNCLYAWSSGGDGAYLGNEIYQYTFATGLWQRNMFPMQVKSWTFGGSGVTSVVGLNNDITDQTAFATAPVAVAQFGHPYMGNVYLPVLHRFAQVSGSLNTNIQQSVNTSSLVVSGPYLVDPTTFDPVFTTDYKIADGSRYQKVGGLAGSDPLGWNGTFQPGLCPAGNMWTDRQTYEGFRSLVSGGTSGLPGGTNASVSVACIENGLDVIYYMSPSPLALFKYVFGGASQYSGNAHAVTYGGDAIVTVGGSPFISFSTADHGLNPQCYLTYDGASGRGMNFAYHDLSPAAQALGGSNPQVTLTSTQLIDRTSGAWAQSLIPIASGGTGMSIGSQLQWDSVYNRFTMWWGGPNIFHITPPAPPVPLSGLWYIDVAPAPTGVAGTDYPAMAESGMIAGIFGNWRYVPAYGVFIGIQNYQTAKVWVYKPHT